MSSTHGTWFGKIVAMYQGLVRGRMNVANEEGCFFRFENTYTAAQLIAGSITLFAASDVPTGRQLVVQEAYIRFAGTLFGGATDVRLSTTETSPIDLLTIAIANTGGSATTGIFSAPTGSIPTGLTQSATFLDRTPLAANHGLILRTTGSAPTGGSAITVMVRGYFV